MIFAQCSNLSKSSECSSNVRNMIVATPLEQNAGDIERENGGQQRVGRKGDERKEDELKPRKRIEKSGGGSDAIDGTAGAERRGDNATARLVEVREERGGDAAVEVEGEKLRVLQRGVESVSERIETDHVHEQVQRLDVRKRREQH